MISFHKLIIISLLVATISFVAHGIDFGRGQSSTFLDALKSILPFHSETIQKDEPAEKPTIELEFEFRDLDEDIFPDFSLQRDPFEALIRRKRNKINYTPNLWKETPLGSKDYDNSNSKKQSSALILSPDNERPLELNQLPTLKRSERVAEDNNPHWFQKRYFDAELIDYPKGNEDYFKTPEKALDQQRYGKEGSERSGKTNDSVENRAANYSTKTKLSESRAKEVDEIQKHRIVAEIRNAVLKLSHSNKNAERDEIASHNKRVAEGDEEDEIPKYSHSNGTVKGDKVPEHSYSSRVADEEDMPKHRHSKSAAKEDKKGKHSHSRRAAKGEEVLKGRADEDEVVPRHSHSKSTTAQEVNMTRMFLSISLPTAIVTCLMVVACIICCRPRGKLCSWIFSPHPHHRGSTLIAKA